MVSRAAGNLQNLPSGTFTFEAAQFLLNERKTLCSRGIGTAGRGAPKQGLALSDPHARAEGFQNLSESFIKHKMNLQAFIESKV